MATNPNLVTCPNEAEEVLIIAPRFRLNNIHGYLQALGGHSNLVPRVRSLQIRSNDTGRSRDISDQTFPPEVFDPIQANGPLICPRTPGPRWFQGAPHFMAECRRIIMSNTQANGPARSQWRRALYHNVFPALLGISLVELPNLTELRVANCKG
ncbi:hypothetical protein EJ04DRAFT_578243 [Polyplosphaeria fusca]|uniref:Uncharacterized protein n=1 Tax=Polyplosphaeria fusca TaxID=682080 RepID=A0A9P4QX86_9PLEO|nr:hypothetical protein EJ04DRAFT_578243 [Polyplosphaeria fusca]